MAQDQIVIVTQTVDPHADEIILALERTGHEPVRINTDEIPLDARVSMSLTSGAEPFEASIEVLTSGRSIRASAIRSVWWRRPAKFSLPDDLTLQEVEFASDETDHALNSLWSSLDCYWMSQPERIRYASWKGTQLRRASKLGFRIPRTLVTTDPDEALDFFDSCDGRMIFKVMTDPLLGANSLARKHPDEEPVPFETPTTLITAADLDLLESVRIAPCMFQEYISKRIELRVTVIGEQVFAAEIRSQEDERTEIDWRHYDADIPYLATRLPEEVADRCRQLVRGYGLNFSALDLILTPESDYVFVESNPNGQFIFIEDKVPELAMIDAVAGCLIRGANR